MGPLAGFRIIELAGLGPAPFCGMLLADMGATVIRVERLSSSQGLGIPADPLLRNRQSVALDLKSTAGVAVLLDLVASADALIEGFRPGVAERLGFGPEVCRSRNPRLVFGRVTGWGQSGPLAHTAGHDINYISLTGALHLIGQPGGKPTPPLNLVGDFGGGGMLLAVGVLAALLEARQSGQGQVVDAAMIDGVTAQLATFYAFRSLGPGVFADATGENFLAGAAPYYDSYQTRDGRWLAIGAIEPQFFSELLTRLGLNPTEHLDAGFPNVDETARKRWPTTRAAITQAVASRTFAEWQEVFSASDSCCTPILTLAEAEQHPHHRARGTHVEIDGVVQNAPAPRFERTPLNAPQPPRQPGADTHKVLAELGYDSQRIATLTKTGVVST